MSGKRPLPAGPWWLLMLALWALIVWAVLALAGCAGEPGAVYDRAGHRLPADCATAAAGAAFTSVVELDAEALEARFAERGGQVAAAARATADCRWSGQGKYAELVCRRPRTVNGFYDRVEQRIYLRAGMAPNERADTLCHERLHVLFGAWHE